MDVRASIPVEDDRDGRTGSYLDTLVRVGGLLEQIRARSGHLTRTWDRSSTEVLEVVVEDCPAPAAEHLVRLLSREHDRVDAEVLAPGSVPGLRPPLWNSGFGGEGLAPLSGRLAAAATPVVLELARRRSEVPGPSGTGAEDALRVMVAHTASTLASSPSLELDGHDVASLLPLRLLSYRSHFEAVVLRTPDPVAFERACSGFYDSHGSIALEAVAAAASGLVPHVDGPAASWSAMVTDSREDVASALRSGAVVDESRTVEDLERDLGRSVAPTRFHAPPTPHMRRLLHDDLDFLVHRLQTSVLYGALFTAGHSLPERWLYCYVVARAAEEFAGADMLELQERLDGVARRLADTSSAVVPERSGRPTPISERTARVH